MALWAVFRAVGGLFLLHTFGVQAISTPSCRASTENEAPSLSLVCFLGGLRVDMWLYAEKTSRSEGMQLPAQRHKMKCGSKQTVCLEMRTIRRFRRHKPDGVVCKTHSYLLLQGLSQATRCFVDG